MTWRRATGLVLVGLAALVLACGDADGDGEDGVDGGAATATATSADASGGGTATAETTATATETAAPEPVTVEIGRSFWHAGWKVDIVDATYTPAGSGLFAEATVTVRVVFDNLGANTARFNSTIALTAGGQAYPDDAAQNDWPNVPGRLSANGEIVIIVDEPFAFDDAVLIVGHPDNNQATVPLGSAGEFVSLEPVVLEVSGEAIAAERLRMAIKGGEVRADLPKEHDEVEAGRLALTLDVIATFESDFAGGYGLTPANFALRLPDGTAVAPDDAPIKLLRGRSPLDGLRVRFLVPGTASGDYALVVIDDTQRDAPLAEIPFTVP